MSASQPEEFLLVARYFDTPDRALAGHGVAVRSRAGGKDAGWHLKRRGGGVVRETGWPESQEMPAALAAEIVALIGDEAAARVRAIAEMRTRRVIVVVGEGSEGREAEAAAGSPGAVELADDEILAIDRQAEEPSGEVRRAWREWESEILGDADPAWLERVEPVLFAAGATPSPSIAKIARATGQLAGLARARGESPEVVAKLEALDAADQAAARRLDA